MSSGARALAVLACLAGAAFCAFGFAASFEPLEGGSPLVWRTGYALGGLAAVIGLAWSLRRSK